MRIVSKICLASLLLVAACKNSSEPTTQNQQLTKEQADELYYGNQYIIVQVVNFLMIQAKTAASGDVANLPVGLGGSILIKPEARKAALTPADSNAFGYAGGGCWTFNYAMTAEGSSYGFDAEACFNTYGQDGKPTTETSTATIAVDLTSSSSYSSEGYSSTSNMTEMENLTVSGVGGFLMGTGNLNVSGTEAVQSAYSYTYGNETESTNISLNFNVVNFIVPLEILYPGGGTINFTIVYQDTSPGSGNASYNIPGSASFNGTNIVAVKFAGFDYQLDLDMF